MNISDEQCDIVDEHDRVVGTKPRHEAKTDFVRKRYANIVIRNQAGQFWIPKRRDDLKRWASGLDFAAGGAVEAGEDYLAAALRELREEIGIDVDPSSLQQIAYLSPYKYPVACFMKVYELIVDAAPGFTPEEYQSAQWYDWSELLSALTASNLPSKTDLLPVLRLCFGALSALDRKVFEP